MAKRLNSGNNKSLVVIPNDITAGLDNLSFETIFGDTSLDQIQNFRSRSHLLHVSVCANAVYLVHVLRTTKKLLKSEESLSKRLTSAKKDDQPSLHIGLIGCGKLGLQIAKCLLSFGELSSENFLISTRRPELLKQFVNQGVRCIKDNTVVCDFADVLMLCILPSQLPQLAKDIKHFIRPDCIIYSIVAGVPISKLSFMLGTTNVLTPNLSWNEKNNSSRRCWNFGDNIITLMKTKDIIEKMLPQENSEHLVQTEERFPEYIAYAVLNLCISQSNLPLDNIVNLAQRVIFGEDVEDKLTRDLFSNIECKSLIDICKKSQEETALMKKLKTSAELKKGFQKRFTEICTNFQEKEEPTEWDWIRENLKAK